MLSGRRASTVSVGIRQQFLTEPPYDLRFTASFLCARSDATSPFGASHLEFGRLVVEAVPYVANTYSRFVRRTSLSCKCSPSGKQDRAQQSYCRNRHSSV